MAKQRDHEVVVKTDCGCELHVHSGCEETCIAVSQSLQEKLESLPAESGRIRVFVPASRVDQVIVRQVS